VESISIYPLSRKPQMFSGVSVRYFNRPAVDPDSELGMELDLRLGLGEGGDSTMRRGDVAGDVVHTVDMMISTL